MMGSKPVLIIYMHPSHTQHTIFFKKDRETYIEIQAS